MLQNKMIWRWLSIQNDGPGSGFFESFYGLINLLDSYKFTVAENTPLEEEVALDPELLGKVFENLLASYTPETQTTARKLGAVPHVVRRDAHAFQCAAQREMFVTPRNADIERGFDLAQVFVERSAQIGQAMVVDGGETDINGFQWMNLL